MILPVYIEPQPILYQPTQPIEAITDEIKELAANMRETMHNAQGIGLAAPQIGQPIALCIVEVVDEDEPEKDIPYLALLNPRITWKSKRLVTMTEGCLSIPGLEGSIRRPDRIRVKAKSLDGEVMEIEASDLLARVLQHEIDHLNGILFTSYIPKRRLKTRPLNSYPQI